MSRFGWIAGFVGTVLLVQAALAQDWPQWMGLARDGVADKSPALLSALPAAGPTMLWEYALPPADKKRPYYTSPVIAGDKVWLHIVAVRETAAPAAGTANPAAATADDVLVCLNLADGKEAWKFTAPGAAGRLGAPNAPCVAGGKVFFAGSSGSVFCVDVADGKQVWKSDLALKGGTFSSSILVADDKVIVADAKLFALDAKTGSKLWENKDIRALHNSPTPWRHEGKTYIIAGQGDQKKKEMWKTFCVDAADGKPLWDVAGGINASPVVSGDLLAMVYWETGLKVYQLAPEGAKEVASVTLETDDNMSSTPAVSGGRVYGFVSKEAFCYDVAKKDFAWKVPVSAKAGSPILADGKIIKFAGAKLLLLDAATGKDPGPAKGAKVETVGHSSPALAGGRLVVNAGTHLRCYDLRKP